MFSFFPFKIKGKCLRAQKANMGNIFPPPPPCFFKGIYTLVYVKTDTKVIPTQKK